MKTIAKCILGSGLVLLANVLLTGCTQNPTGVFVQDFSVLADVPPDTAKGREAWRIYAAEQGDKNRITFAGDRLEVRMDKQFQLQGKFTVSGHQIFVSPDKIKNHPLSASATNPPTTKLAYDMYMPNPDTIMFKGLTFRRKG